MNSNYLKLVNDVCLRLNEEQLTESNFQSSLGIHASIKTFVRDAVTTIMQAEAQWPFAAIEHTIKLDLGTTEYAWPENFDSVDWQSFFLIPNIEESRNGYQLRPIQKEEWYKRGRARDSELLPKGINLPTHVFETHGNGFGISPNPDKEYTLKYRYWRVPKILKEWDDECPLPMHYDYLVLACGMMLMSMFLDNTERATFWEAQYIKYLKDAKRKLMGNNFKEVNDTRVNF